MCAAADTMLRINTARKLEPMSVESFMCSPLPPIPLRRAISDVMRKQVKK